MNVEIRHSRKEDIAQIRDIYVQNSCYADTTVAVSVNREIGKVFLEIFQKIFTASLRS